MERTLRVDEIDADTAQEVLQDYENGTLELTIDDWQRVMNSVYSWE